MPTRLDSPMMGFMPSPTYGMAAPSGNSLEEMLAGLSPGQLQQYLAAASGGSERQLAGQQLDNANQAYGARRMGEGHITPGGAIGGGIGDLLTTIRGSMDKSQGMAGLQSALGNEQATNQILAQILRGQGLEAAGQNAGNLTGLAPLLSGGGGLLGGFGGF